MNHRQFLCNSFVAAAVFSGCSMIKLNLPGLPGSSGTSGGNASEAARQTADTSKLALPKQANAVISKDAVGIRLLTDKINVDVTTYATDLGLRCGAGNLSGYSTAAPAYSFVVKDTFDLRVRMVDGTGGVLLFPDGTSQCDDQGTFAATTYPKGIYHLFLVTSASSASTKLEFSSAAAARKNAPSLVVATANRNPAHVETAEVNYVSSFHKVFASNDYGPDCGIAEASDVPSAFVEIGASTPSTAIGVWGRNFKGFVVRTGATYYLSCGNVLAPPKEGWPKGKLEIFPLGNLKQPGNRFTVTVHDPSAPAHDAATQTLTFNQKLDKPMFVTVPLRDGRWRMPEVLFRQAGHESETFVAIPDLIVKTTRPIAGLVIRPLAGVDARMVWECLLASCNMSGGSKRDSEPTWRVSSELALGGSEAELAVYLGAPAGATGNVTLMIYDDSTELSPYAPHQAGEPRSVADRELARWFPQLNVSSVSRNDRKGLEARATVFAAAPRAAFVAPSRDLDEAMAKSSYSNLFPKEGEPLLILAENQDATSVFAADGTLFTVRTKDLGGTPELAKLPGEPRAWPADMKMDELAGLAPTSSKTAASYYKAVNARERCADRVWEPYRRSMTFVGNIVIENAAYHRAQDQGNRAINKKCGTQDALAKKQEAARKILHRELEASRPKLLAAARPSWQ